MIFLLDENQPRSLRTRLRELGHDATVIGLDYPSGLRDPEVLAISLHEGRSLITLDTDFGELIFRRGIPHRGVILLRLRDERPAALLARVEHLLVALPDRLDEFVVVSEAGIRVRARSFRLDNPP